MKIAFYKGQYGTWQDKLICRATNSIYSHCELVINNDTFCSASPRDGGLRIKKMPITYKWDAYTVLTPDHRNYTGTAEDEILNWFVEHSDFGYDWLGAFCAWVNLEIDQADEARFCSSVCGEMLSTETNLTPVKLYENLVFSNRLIL